MTNICVGVSEWHGMMQEVAANPPFGVEYSSAVRKPRALLSPVRSPIKGFMPMVEASKHNIIEAVISPVITKQRWVYSLAHFAEALAFNIWGIPVPRSVRAAYVRNMLCRENCKKIIFWSQAGRATLTDYGGVKDQEILNKVAVVYPAIREIEEIYDGKFRKRGSSVQICFGGDFFRKGGANLVDAFERAQRHFPAIALRLCCDENIDFNTEDQQLRQRYLKKIRRNANITVGKVSHERMMREILPQTDIYAIPTYVEAFGVAIIEAMACELPVIATNYFAIPEMVEDGRSGFLIDTARFDCERLFRGYVVKNIPEEFHEYMSEQTYEKLCVLLESAELRKNMGKRGREIVRSRFSMQIRNAQMREIYEVALA